MSYEYGYVYFFIKEGTMQVKIGESDNPERRRREISGSSGETITEINRIYCQYPKDLEKIFQEVFANKTHKNEWFNLKSKDIINLHKGDFLSAIEENVFSKKDVEYFIRRIEEFITSGRIKKETKRMAINNIKIKKETHEKLEQIASSTSTTINGIVANILDKYIESELNSIHDISQPSKSLKEKMYLKQEQKDNHLYQRVLTYILQKGVASTRSIVKQFRVGENRADRLMERLEKEGIIEPKKGPMARKVIKRPPFDKPLSSFN